MLIKKILYLFLIIFTAAIFQECCGPEPRFFRRKNMQILHKSDKVLPNQFSSETLIADTGLKYFLKVKFDIDYIASGKIKFPGFSFNKCYASPGCDEFPGMYGALEKITAINVTSDADFDSTFTAGKSLNKMFRIVSFNYYYRNFTYSLDSVKNSPTNEGRYPDLGLLLMQRPSASQIHKFKVELALSNGQTISAESPEATFRK